MCSLLLQTLLESLQVSDGGPSVDLDQILKKPPRPPPPWARDWGDGACGEDMQIPTISPHPMSPFSDQPLLPGSRTAPLTAYRMPHFPGGK